MNIVIKVVSSYGTVFHGRVPMVKVRPLINYLTIQHGVIVIKYR